MNSTAKTVEAILNKEDKAVLHIIAQNDSLQKKIESLQRDMSDLSAEKEEFEHDVDSLTKSKNILQGYVKNFHELNKLEKNLNMNNYTMYSNFYRMYYTQVVVSMIFYVMLFYTNTNMVIIPYLAFVIGNIVIAKHHYEFNQKYTLKNKLLCEDIKKLHKANDMVNDLLDNL